MFKRKVCRDNIFVGDVAKVNYIGRVPSVFNYDYENDRPNNLRLYSFSKYRNIIFIPDKNRRANDLQYNSPKYPILNISPNYDCLNSKIVIHQSYNLSLLLKYFGYDEYLNFEDIERICQRIFTGRFGKDNCMVFGFKEIISECFEVKIDGSVDNSSYLRYQVYKNSLGLDSERKFKKISDNILPRELMSVLDSIIYDNGVFEPNIDEGQIKRLTKFRR